MLMTLKPATRYNPDFALSTSVPHSLSLNYTV